MWMPNISTEIVQYFIKNLEVKYININSCISVYQMGKHPHSWNLDMQVYTPNILSLQDQCVSSADLLGDPWCGSYITSPTPLQAVDYTALASVRETWKIMQRNLVRIDPMRWWNQNRRSLSSWQSQFSIFCGSIIPQVDDHDELTQDWL